MNLKKYPFKFLDAYTREDRSFFFGRDQEINLLYEMVFQSPIILIYGASGTGKTSLIDCGLANKFQPHDWHQLSIRRGNNINSSLKRALFNAGGDFDIEAKKGTTTNTNETGHPDNLSPVGHALKTIYQKSFRPIYLIFDQFEEIFILGHKPEQKQFISTVKDILKSNQPVKLIFSIREEYLGHLFEFEKEVPQLLQKKLRIEAMNLDKVTQVIVGATSFQDSNISIKTGEQQLIAQGIFEKIKGSEKSLTIQLPFLQVFLDKFYLKITDDQNRIQQAEFSMEKLNEMDTIGNILIDFLEDRVKDISSALKKTYATLSSVLIWKILSPFATLDGTKEPINKINLYERLPDLDKTMIDDVVNAFVNSRMLRYNESDDSFEIAHDALAKPIAEKRSVEDIALLEVRQLIKSQVQVKTNAREYFTEKQLIFIEPYLDKFKPTNQEKDWIAKSHNYVREQKEIAMEFKQKELVKAKRTRNMRMIMVGLIVFVGVFIYLALKARKSEIVAQEAKVEAQKAEDYSNELLKLVMKDRGEKYQNVNDSVLKEYLYTERFNPLSSLIIPRGSVSSNKGSDKSNFMLWLDMPSFRKAEIQEVQYKLCPGFVDRLRISEEPSSSFAIGYLGWGYCPTIDISVILKTGDTIEKVFSFEDYFENNGLE